MQTQPASNLLIHLQPHQTGLKVDQSKKLVIKEEQVIFWKNELKRKILQAAKIQIRIVLKFQIKKLE